MQRPDLRPRAVAIAIHDASPRTWGEVRELLAMVDDAGAAPISLLVVPDFHRLGAVTADAAFVRAMEARLARGDELVLHGYHHLDDAPPPRTLRAWFQRRMLTRSEGEFAAIGREAARLRIDRGIAMFGTLGWPLHGFVPPAWLLNDAARDAVSIRRCFDYVTIRSGIFRLPDWRFERTANLCYSPDTAARRAVSAAAIQHELRRARSSPLLRISLHPQDARVPAVLAHWQRLISDALMERAAVTKYGWVSGFMDRSPAAPVPAVPRADPPDAVGAASSPACAIA